MFQSSYSSDKDELVIVISHGWIQPGGGGGGTGGHRAHVTYISYPLQTSGQQKWTDQVGFVNLAG